MRKPTFTVRLTPQSPYAVARALGMSREETRRVLAHVADVLREEAAAVGSATAAAAPAARRPTDRRSRAIGASVPRGRAR